ncbi:MAG: AlkA N-terminal domain-containing protein [Acidimicrobiales bacterium]
MTGPTAAAVQDPPSSGSAGSAALLPSPEECYRAVLARDARFDGWIWIGVTSTGIYCRPSCPTPVHPRPEHATFHATAAAAQRAGYRACKRCRPDASPGSPLWDRDHDLVGRAMRLIADGVVERSGVGGLAQQLAVSTRHLDRVLGERVGAGPLAIARARRAQTARVLIETTDLRFGDVAFAAGFSSIRQFNDTLRAVFDQTPTQLRQAAERRGRPAGSTAAAPGGSGSGGTAARATPLSASVSRDGAAPVALSLRLAHRTPLAVDELMGWFAGHPIAGVQGVDDGVLTRTLRLPHGNGVARLAFDEGHVRCDLRLDDVRDVATAAERCRRLLDLDADIVAIDADLCADPVLAPVVGTCPGLRTPGSVGGFETAVLALAGQQISVAAACATVGRLVERLGTPTFDGLRVFPAPDAVADGDLDGLGFTARTRDAVRTLAQLCAGGLSLDPGADRTEARARLLEIRGVGPWTADYVRLRALRDPDVLPVGDLIVRRSAAALGLPDSPEGLAEAGRRWSPWRTYATHHLWQLELDARLRSEGRARR